MLELGDDLRLAIKLLKEDESLQEDARNRASFLRIVQQENRSGGATLDLIVKSLQDLMGTGRSRDTLRRQAEERLGAGPYTVDTAAAFFDVVVNDPTVNDNARLRVRLRKLFRDEANSVADLSHPNIVSILDYGDHKGVPFLAQQNGKHAHDLGLRLDVGGKCLNCNRHGAIGAQRPVGRRR